MIDGRPRPDHGPGQIEHVCTCGGSWVGPVDEACWWCARSSALQLEHYRRDLLWPDWMIPQGPAYDSLTDVDRAVWDQTRGIVRGADSVKAWTRRLLEAVDADVITATEARAALSRARKRDADG